MYSAQVRTTSICPTIKQLSGEKIHNMSHIVMVAGPPITSQKYQGASQSYNAAHVTSGKNVYIINSAYHFKKQNL